MLLGASLIQWSAAIVTHVFGEIGPSATSAWRFILGAVVLLAFTRPNLRTWTKQQWLGALALGISVAFMNQCFYQAIARIPLGAAVAIEYLGPFMVSALGKRSARHFAFVVLAGITKRAFVRDGAGHARVAVTREAVARACAFGGGSCWSPRRWRSRSRRS